MTAAAPLRTDVATVIAPAALAMVLALSAQEPLPAQDDRAEEPGASSTSPLVDGPGPNVGPAAIRILPPGRHRGERLSGRVEIQTLVIDPSITEVEFLLDGNQTKRATKKPYTTNIRLADPPREQTLEVRGYDGQGKYLGSDRIILNRLDAAFLAHIVEVRPVQENEHAAYRVEAAVSVPRSATLERVDFYRGQHRVEAVRNFGGEAPSDRPRTIAVEALMESTPAAGFVRVVAKLADGRQWEDAELLQGADYRSEIDVQLVQLQVQVTNRKGDPEGRLTPDDFEVRENGDRRPVEDLHPASDIPLVLGFALDSSSSMLPIRRPLIDVATGFLEAALSTGDRAFLVHFNHTVRVLQPLSASKELLARQLHHLSPRGGTALNDAILFSLLQYRDEPGRRALIVVTDGVDEHSRSEPKQSAEFAERLGLPIYFIQLLRPGMRPRLATGRANFDVGAMRALRKSRRRLQRISQQTGGRLFTIEVFVGTAAWTEQLQQVLDQIRDDLRHQHVLTYYSNQPVGAAIEPEVRMTRRGLTLRSAVPLK